MAGSSLQTLDRALDLIDILAKAPHPMSAAELSKRLEISRTAIYAMLNSLQERDYLEKDKETGRYSINYKIYEMGMLFRRRFPFLQIAQSYTFRLREKWSMGTHISIYVPGGKILLLTEDYPVGIRIFHEGSIGPAHATASGKVLLAGLPDEELEAELKLMPCEAYTPHTITSKSELLEIIKKTRRDGYAVEDQELVIGLACFSTPLLDASGRTIASMSISGESEKLMKNLNDIIKDGMLAARGISVY